MDEPDLVQVVTFLNRSLKMRGLIFGLSRHGSGYRLSIYAVPGDEGAVPTEGPP
jgi:hypothetical protein